MLTDVYRSPIYFMHPLCSIEEINGILAEMSSYRLLLPDFLQSDNRCSSPQTAPRRNGLPECLR